MRRRNYGKKAAPKPRRSVAEASRPINIVQSEPAIAADVMADAIVKLSEATQALSRSKLKRDTLILLLHEATKIARRDIALVLNALEQLGDMYVKPEKAKGLAR